MLTVNVIFFNEEEEESGRARAVKRFRFLAGLALLLAGLNLGLGVFCLTVYPHPGSGPPYYTGTFVIGVLVKF